MQLRLVSIVALLALSSCTVFENVDVDDRVSEDVGARDTTARDAQSDPADGAGGSDGDDVGDAPDVSDDGREADGDTVTRNGCGGTTSLVWQGDVTVPGQPCGDCGGGRLVCNGTEALRCAGASRPNVCGGCGELAETPGDTCGDCGDGTYQCRDGDLVCVGQRPTNRCGGCDELTGRPGDSCVADGDDGGVWICNGTDAVRCDASDASNACGGTATLSFAETEAAPGDPCRTACGEGLLVCDGIEALRCDGVPAANACGGCQSLAGQPDTVCGSCGGTWTCEGDRVVCEGDTTNRCGGCEELPEEPGTECGAGSIRICATPDRVVCVARGADLNACGGETELPAPPGSPCGLCDSGIRVCNDRGSVDCVDESAERNACGGCTPLAAPPDTPCGTCGSGRWTCAEDGESVACEGDLGDDARNECGGCRALDRAVGDVCGSDCATGTLACDGADALLCDRGDDIELNECGGCGELEDLPGETCGTCGVLACVGSDEVACEDPGTNACGGCAELDGSVGDACGECGALACADDDTLVCVEGTGNACGGCAELDGSIGDACGECGALACDGEDALRCDDPGENACGGCEPLDGDVGEPCGDCGTIACDGEESLRCDDPGANECGGCEPLGGSVGDACGECGALACDGSEALRCEEGVGNACGGCEPLGGSIGDACGECGALSCDGEEALRCDDPGTNVCGGCGALEGSVGDACGECGQLRCDGGDGGLACDDPGRNDCGGCSTLPMDVGATCGQCGVVTCDGPDSVSCDDPGRNDCGGCGALDAAPGEACGACAEWRCDESELACVALSEADSDDDGVCDPLDVCPGFDDGADRDEDGAPDGCDACPDEPAFSTETNECGGCSVLMDAVGDSCADCSVYECVGDALACVSEPDEDGDGVCDRLDTCPMFDDRQDADDDGVPDGCDTCPSNPDLSESINACAGCASLMGEPGESCGTCGIWVCDGIDSVSCSDPGANACGGCDALAAPVGTRCFACGEGSVACDTDDPSGDAVLCSVSEDDRIEFVAYREISLFEPCRVPSPEAAARRCDLRGAAYESDGSTWRRSDEPFELPLQLGSINETIGVWPLDGDADDAGPYGSNGVYVGAEPTDGAFGDDNGALLLNGVSGYIVLPTTAPFGGGAFSVGLRIRPSGSGACGQDAVLVDREVAGAGGGDWRVDLDESCRPRFTVGVGTTDESIAAQDSIPAGEWTHVVASRYRDGAIGLYVDGRLVAYQLASRGTVESSNAIYFGRRGLLPERYFDGAIDDAVILPRGLHPREVEALFRGNQPFGTALFPESQPDLDDIRVIRVGEGGLLYDVDHEIVGARPLSTTVDDSVAGYWRLEESFRNVVADAPSLSPVGPADPDERWTHGRFDGSRAILLGGSTPLALALGEPSLVSGTSDLTVELWIRPGENLTALGYDPILLAAGNRGESDPALELRYTEAGSVVFELDATTTAGVHRRVQTGVYPLRKSQWHHIAVTKRGSTLSVFLDGIGQIVTEDVGGDPGDALPALDTWYLGRGLTEGPTPPVIAFDEIIVHGRALDADEIARRTRIGMPRVRFMVDTASAADATGEFPFERYRVYWGAPTAERAPLELSTDDGDPCETLLSPCNGYVGWWRLDDIGATFAWDASSNQLHGGFVGLPGYTGGTDGVAMAPNSEFYISVPHTATLDVAHFSLEATVAVSADGTRNTIAAKGRGGSLGQAFLLQVNSFRRLVAAYNDTSGRSVSVLPDFPTGLWVTTSMTVDGSALRAYVAHFLADSETATSGAGFVGDPMNIGIRDATSGSAHLFNGQLDSIRLMDRALDPHEQLHLPLAAWRLGPTVSESSICDP